MRLEKMPSEFQEALPILEKIKAAGFEAYFVGDLSVMPSWIVQFTMSISLPPHTQKRPRRFLIEQ